MSGLRLAEIAAGVELVPIEQFFAKFKAFIRKVASYSFKKAAFTIDSLGRLAASRDYLTLCCCKPGADEAGDHVAIVGDPDPSGLIRPAARPHGFGQHRREPIFHKLEQFEREPRKEPRIGTAALSCGGQHFECPMFPKAYHGADHTERSTRSDSRDETLRRTSWVDDLWTSEERLVMLRLPPDVRDQVANSRRTPRLRILPSVIGRIGSSKQGIVESGFIVKKYLNCELSCTYGWRRIAFNQSSLAEEHTSRQAGPPGPSPPSLRARSPNA